MGKPYRPSVDARRERRSGMTSPSSRCDWERLPANRRRKDQRAVAETFIFRFNAELQKRVDVLIAETVTAVPLQLIILFSFPGMNRIGLDNTQGQPFHCIVFQFF